MVATSNKWLLKFKIFLIKKYNLKFSFLTALGTFQDFSSYMWLMTTILDSTELNIFIISHSSVGQGCLLRPKGVNGMGLSDTLAK